MERIILAENSLKQIKEAASNFRGSQQKKVRLAADKLKIELLSISGRKSKVDDISVIQSLDGKSVEITSNSVEYHFIEFGSSSRPPKPYIKELIARITNMLSKGEIFNKFKQ